MKKAIVLILSLMATTGSAELGGTYVTGHVIEAETGMGIQGADVIVNGPPPSYATVASGSTDETGLYWLQIDSQGFQPGTYTVRIITFGYDDLSTNPQEFYVNKQPDIVDMPDFLTVRNPLPVVDAGLDISTTDSSTPQTVRLDGSVTDDGPLLLIRWSQISGPGNVSFLDTWDPKTTATFDALGSYELQLLAIDYSPGESIDTVTVQIGPENTAPVANDENYSTTENVPISVGPPGVLANDGDEQNDSFQVVSPGGQSVRGTLVLSPDGSFTYTPAQGFWGIDTYTYKISDGKGGEATATITFEVAAINLPPLATASASSSQVWVGDSVGFDGSASYDPDGIIVTYDWDFGDGGTGTGSNTTYTYSTPGFYTVWLTVWDDGGLSASDPVAINVNRRPLIGSPNEDPVVDAGPDRSIKCDFLPCVITLDGSAQDPDSYPSPLTVEWTRLSGPGMVTFDNPSNPTTTARFPAYGTYVLALRADDGEVTVVDQVRITVEEGSGQDQGPTACSPIAHWRLDEGSGISTKDSSGNGHDGTLVGSPRWTDGPDDFGRALAFSRVNYVDILHETEFDLTGEITVAAWASISRIDAQWSPIVAKGNSAWRLSTRADQTRFHFAVTGPGEGPNWINGECDVRLGQWHHIVGTYDGAQIRLYIDGVEDPASPVPYSGPVSTNDYAVWIGGNAQFPGNGFYGRIDDVRIYDCALTQDEITSLMEIPSSIGMMHVREVIDNGPIAGQNDCEDSLASGLGTIVDYEAPFLNILDSGSNGHFGNDSVFAVVTEGKRAAGAVDHLSMEADGIIRIPTGQGGDWTFGVNSDDGFTLYLPGRRFRYAVNGELISDDDYTALQYGESRAVQDTLGTVYLPAGDHFFRLTYHEATGGAALEFFAARGVHKQYDPDVFRLVGQPDIGAVAVPGLCGQITMTASQPGAWTGGSTDSLADALAALAQGQSDQSNLSGQYQFVNHGDPDTGGTNSGYLLSDAAFPNNIAGRNEDDFVVRVTGQLDIPEAGTYQIGFNSDDGAYLRIYGRRWKTIVEDATGSAQISGDKLMNDSITGWSFTAGEIELQAGCHSFEILMFERGGGAFLEFFGRGFSDKGIVDPSWHLLRAGGAQTGISVSGLQLVKTE